MEAAIFVSLWFGSSLRTGSLQVRARAKNYRAYDVKRFSVSGRRFGGDWSRNETDLENTVARVQFISWSGNQSSAP